MSAVPLSNPAANSRARLRAPVEPGGFTRRRARFLHLLSLTPLVALLWGSALAQDQARNQAQDQAQNQAQNQAQDQAQDQLHDQALDQAQDLYLVPGATARVEGDAIVIRIGQREETYVAGLGWLSGLAVDPPVVAGGDVMLSAAALAALGVDLPRLAGVRTSGQAEIRVVLDLAGVRPVDLAGMNGQGAVSAGQALDLTLPPLLLPTAPLEDVAGIEMVLDASVDGTNLRLTGPAFSYEYFALSDPARLVIDVIPRRVLAQPTVQRPLAPGVSYRRFNYQTNSGGSVVHVVSVEPGSGEFRVVGESHVPRTVSQLASGASIALNAGYFDTATFDAIGYLLIDGGLLSLPSRNRASIAFSDQGASIARLSASIALHTSLGLIEVGNLASGVGVLTTAGALAGRPNMGVLIVQDGLVVENKIGPRQVPEADDSYALVYPPTNRQLALLDAGDRVYLDTSIEPSVFDEARYAVEAGPLLLKDGQRAYEPSLEGFAAGQRILDGLTQQAAIGIAHDGSILLVVAETMRASELIGLFESLGASDAMRLDSGSSTTLVIDGDVVNRSSERRVVSAIVFLPNKN